MKLSRKVGNRSASAKARSKRAFKTQIYRKIMTVVAILITLWPVVTVGYWLKTFLYDSRPTQNLSHVSRTYSDLTPFSQPMVSITFDDGWESAYKNAAPILSKYNIPSTFYIITNTFEQQQYISTKQIKSLSQAGHEIESHTVTHPDLTQIDSTQLTNELSQSKKEAEKVTGKPVTDFSSPLDAYNDTVVAQVKAQGYRSHRTTDGDLKNTPYNLNLREEFDPYHIQAYTVRNTTTTEQLRSFLAYARQNNAWVVLVYHQVEDTSVEIPDKDRYAISKKAFEEQMQIVTQSNMRIVTLEQVLDAIAKLPPKATVPGENK